MTLPKKGSRIIEVNKCSYRYMVTGNDMIIDVIVEMECVQGQKLTASFDYHNVTSNNSMKAQERKVTPAIIRKLVEYGIENGWTPKAKGQPKLVVDGESLFPID